MEMTLCAFQGRTTNGVYELLSLFETKKGVILVGPNNTTKNVRERKKFFVQYQIMDRKS
jgi:hypothetical protein